MLAEGKKKVLETTTNAHGLADYCDTLIEKKLLKDERSLDDDSFTRGNGEHPKDLCVRMGCKYIC